MRKVEFFDTTNDVLFIRLGNTKDITGIKVDGEMTVKNYLDVSNLYGNTWFGTNSLRTGIAKKKLKEFNEITGRGDKIKIVIAIGKKGNGNNTIKYSADIIELESNKVPTSKSGYLVPAAFNNQAFKIWLKLNNIKLEAVLNESNLNVKSSKNLLKKSISNSQFHFGYLTRC